MAAVNHATGGRTYGGQTGEQRAAARRASLVDAAYSIAADEGWGALSIEAVCRRAGLNKRYAYEAFEGGLDGLVAALMAQVADGAVDVALGVIDDAAGADDARVAAGIGAFVEHLTDDPRRARVLFGALPAGEAAAAHRDAALRRLIATVADTGRTLHGIDDPVVETAAAMLIGGTSQAVLDLLDGRIRGEREDAIADLVALWQAISDAAAARARQR